jgi:hypothetical protein
MSNRAQRRAAKHKGKRQGETYADVLAKKRMIKEAVDKSVHDRSVSIEADIKSQRLEWMSVVALNRAFGFGGKRSRLFLETLAEVANEVTAMANEHGAVYAKTKLMESAGKILEIELSPMHEEEMREARIKNEKEGIFFPADDPDAW